MLVNDLVDTSGITYAYRISEDVGVGPVDAVRSYVATDAIFKVGEVWHAIRAAGDAGVPVTVTDRMTLDLRRLIDRAGRWLLNYRPQPLAVGAEINRFAETVSVPTACSPRSPGYPAMTAGIRWRGWPFAMTSTGRCAPCAST